MPPTKTSWTLPEQFDEYRLIRMLGRGNMGVVFLGHDLVLDRPVAIKFLNNVDADPRARERFLTEARAAARIHHPNVMAIHRVGELEGRLYIIGEYIRGHSLSDLQRPIPWEDALKIAIGLARGLACAHRQGVLHRDIKLANAMQSESGEVKLLDFSLAKLLEGGPPPPDEVHVAASTLPTELESTGIHIDPGARGGRPVDSSLQASPRILEKISDLGSTLTKVDPQAIQRMRRAESSDGVVVGTPFYMAPELWRAVPASRTTDVYALGVLLYILCTNHPPIDGKSTFELARLTQETRPKPLRALAPSVDPRFAEIVDRCLRPATEDRYTSGDELCSALEILSTEGARETAAVVQGNPYRGLQAFEARHRAVFFGRGAEIRAVTDRLRAEPFLLVAGDSGVGKSSLCRAGVLPMFSERASDGRAWSTLSLMPGRRPLQTLVSALAAPLKATEDHLRDLFETDPAELSRLIVRQQGKTHGIVLFIDQLEELVTLAEPVQRIVVGRFLAEVASGLPGVRLLATARGDFLTRVAALPEVGRYINAAIYLLTPLTPDGVREAIVGPARLQGVNFESEELVETLGTAGVEGNLPLLQFALAELWEARDPATRKITAADLERIGRVTGALTRHADNVVAGLPASQRVAVRRLLMRLVTIEDTRASLPLEDLVLGDVNNETALEALVRGRLVVAREAQDGTVYEIAHEALIRNWDTLQRWITEERESREIYHRLEVAAVEWQRLGGGRLGLWTAEQFTEASRLDRTTFRQREREFLDATRIDLVRRRWVLRIIVLAVPIVLGLVYVGIRLQDARTLTRRIDEQLTAAVGTIEEARGLATDASRLRQQAYQSFDTQDAAGGETTWAEAQAVATRSDTTYKQVTQQVERALSLEANNPRARALMVDIMFERALLLEARGKPELAEELLERLKGYDEDGSRIQQWNAPATLDIEAKPPSSELRLGRYEPDAARRLVVVDERVLGPAPQRGIELPAGSYRVTLAAPGRETVTYPLRVERGEQLKISVTLPAAGAIPPGFAYIPRSRFLFGSDEEDIIRAKFYLAAPQHAVETGSYIIAKRETTYGEYLEFLRAQTPEVRRARAPRSAAENLHVGVRLEELPAGTWQLTVSAGEAQYVAVEGAPIHYLPRKANAVQDWSQMAVSATSQEDVLAYMKWLDTSGKVPGARFCTEWEWEHAVRGADGRGYPHGDYLTSEEANIDATYGKVAVTMGPDAGGLHPASRSPFGLDDAVGNVWEWTSSSLAPDEMVIRGGAFFFDEVTCSSMNRYVVPDPTMRDGTLGLRVCADWHDAE
jgi:eukaryotic-like serine/threonine-protein kinase